MYYAIDDCNSMFIWKNIVEMCISKYPMSLCINIQMYLFDFYRLSYIWANRT